MSRQQDYVNEVYGHAREMGLNHVQASLAASQAALETQYGKSVKGNNHFGIKAGRSWSGPTVNFATKEEVNGKLVGQRDTFRGYQGIKDSIRDYAAVLEAKFPDAWNAQTFDAAVKGLDNGKYGRYASDRRYGSKLGYINGRFGLDDVYARAPSQPLLDAMERNKNNAYVSLPIDTSWAALGSMPSMPGIDGLTVTERGGIPSPASKRDNPTNPSFPDNAVGPLAERMGSYAAPVSTVADLMGALGAPVSQSQQGIQATATATQGFGPSHHASVNANVGGAFGPSRDSIIDGYQEYAASRGAPTAVAGVPSARFDQAFSVFGAPNQSTVATTTGLPALDAPQTIASRPEAIGYQAPEALTSQQEEKSKDKEKDFDWFDKSNAKGAAIGLLTGGLPGAVVGGLAPTAVRGAQALMGNGFGGLGGLGGIFDGSPSANTQALGYARDMTIGNPYATQQDFMTNYMGAMRGFTGNPNIDPFGGLPRDGRVAEFNQALRDQGLAISLMDGLSRDLGGAFGGFGGGNSGSGGGRGGSRGGGGRGGMGGRESGSYGADG